MFLFRRLAWSDHGIKVVAVAGWVTSFRVLQMVKFVCEFCDHVIGTAGKNAGKRIRCPYCRNLALVDPVEEDASPLESPTPATPSLQYLSVKTLDAQHAAPAIVVPHATFARPSTAEQIAARAAVDPNLPVLRQTPAQLIRYCITGYDRAVRMEVRFQLSAESDQAARQRAERNGLEVHTVVAQEPAAPDEFDDAPSRRRGY
jgi:DNA-directed RNA polymerase subunit RPC12/RpoP